MNTEDNTAQREMTLREFVARLPKDHRVRVELTSLEAENAAMREALKQISCLGTDCAPGDSLSSFVESQLYTAISVATRALSGDQS